MVVGLEMARDESNLTTEHRIINKNSFLQCKLQTREANASVSQEEKLIIVH